MFEDQEITNEEFEKQLEEDLGGAPVGTGQDEEKNDDIETPDKEKPEEGSSEEEQLSEEEPGEKETEEEGEINPFEIEEEDEPNEAIQKIAQELGIEAETSEELVAQIKSKGDKDNSGESAFANDEIKELNEFVKNGGSLLKARDVKAKVSDLKEEIGKYDTAISTLDGVLKVTNPAEIKSFLQKYYTNMLGMEGQALKDAMGQIDQLIEDEHNGLLITEMYRAQREWKSSLEKQRNEKQGRLTSAETEEKSLFENAAKTKAAADKEFEKVLTTYQDPDGKSYTRRARLKAKAAYNTPMVTSEVPQGFAEVFFMTDGKLDMDKMMKNISLLTNNEAKRETLKKKVENGYFRNLQGYKKGTMKRGEGARAKKIGKADDLGGEQKTHRRGEFIPNKK